jgi:hypothetical protein
MHFYAGVWGLGLAIPFWNDCGIVFLEPQVIAVHFFRGGKMKEVEVFLCEDLSLPVFRLLDPKLMANPQYARGARDGYFNQVSESACLECADYMKGALAGIALWDVCLNIKNHDREVFERVFTESPTSEAMIRVRRFISEFSNSQPNPRKVLLRKAKQVPSALSASWDLSPRFIASEMASAQ